jgi:hypothetical protein
MKFKIILYTILLFLLETLLQSIYYSIKIKHFTPFNEYNKIIEIFWDALYVIGSVKLVFFLPLYIVFYLTKNKTSRLIISLYHAVVFFSIYMLIIFIFPVVLRSYWDIIILTFIAFLSSLMINMPMKSDIIEENTF